MRAGITWTGVLVLVLGLIVLTFGTYYADLYTQYAGGIVSVLGLATGIVGAYMKPK